MSSSPAKVSGNGTRAAETSPLLLTKLYVPPPRPAPVPRPHLITRLNAGLSRRLTLISAPAGFGKTTLLREWRAAPPAAEMPWAWLSLDAGDNDPLRFWDYFIAAVQTVRGEIGVASRLRLFDFPTPPIERTLAPLLNDLSATTEELLLVLDDYHHIEAESIHEGMAFLLDHLPPHIHLVVAGRTQPPLPLSLWRGRGELSELHGEELRFSPAETALFLNRVMGVAVTDEQAAALTARTEGWIVSLQMAALALQEREDVEQFIAGFGGDHRSVSDYLVEQVLEGQPAPVQGFLLKTAVLGRMCGPLCEAVTDEMDGEAMLARLEAANLFLVPLDDQRRWYRYHHLFAEVLRHQLQRANPDAIPALHRRAARWYAQNELVEEALEHAFAGEDFAWAADVIEAQYTYRGIMLDNMALARHLLRLPPELMYERPRLLTMVASTLGLAGSYYPAVKELLAGAEMHFEGGELDDLNADAERRYERFNLSILRINAAGHALDPEGVDEGLAWLLERLPAEDHRLRHIAYTRAANSYVDCGETLAAEWAVNQAMRHPLPATDPHYLRCQVSVAWAKFARGDYNGMMKIMQQNWPILEQHKNSAGGWRRGTAWDQTFIGWLLYEWNDLDAALNHLQLGASIAMEMRSDVIRYYSLSRLALVHLALGDVDAADRAIWNLTHGESFFGLLTSSISAWQARYWLLRGDVESAGRWARESGLSIYDDPAFPRCVFIYPAFIRVLTAEGRGEESLHLLDLLTQRAEVKGRLRHLVEFRVLQAAALETQGDSQAALDALEKAVVLAEPAGRIRTFVDEGPIIGDLLGRLLPRTTAPAYVEKVLAAFPDRAVSSARSSLSALTARETEVLGLVAQGLSNQAIAEKLVVAVSTVERHLNNIYAKLQVHNRVQAVNRATALGLLPL